MGIFNSIDKTKTSKKFYEFNLQEIYRKGRFATPSDIDYSFFVRSGLLMGLWWFLRRDKSEWNETFFCGWFAATVEWRSIRGRA